MSESSYPYLLVLVEGPSEAASGEHPADAGGVVRTVITHVFGDEVARHLQVKYWRYTPRSPLRVSANGRRISARAAQIRHAIEIGNVTTIYGAVVVVDNDCHYKNGRPQRLEELREGAEASGCREKVAIGVAQEMIEAWLLADPNLLHVGLPPGKRCEDLWGDKHDKKSNHPKHVLRRCVLEPGRMSFIQAVSAWDVVRARPNARSLDAFVREVEELADRQYAR